MNRSRFFRLWFLVRYIASRGGAVVAMSVSLGAGCVHESPTVTEAMPGWVWNHADRQWIGDRLYLGRDIPGGGKVSEADWQAFMDEEVTPRFPDGLTVWRAQGQWRGADGKLVREATFILEIFHEASAETEQSLEAIIAEYKKRFRQESVLRATVPTQVRFY